MGPAGDEQMGFFSQSWRDCSVYGMRLALIDISVNTPTCSLRSISPSYNRWSLTLNSLVLAGVGSRLVDNWSEVDMDFLISFLNGGDVGYNLLHPAQNVLM